MTTEYNSSPVKTRELHNHHFDSTIWNDDILIATYAKSGATWMDQDGHPFWPFWENVRTWWQYRHQPNCLFVHFNNLKQDAPAEMRRIACFLDIPIDESRWDSIVECCSFDWMKKNAAQSVPLGGAEVFIHKEGEWAQEGRVERGGISRI